MNNTAKSAIELALNMLKNAIAENCYRQIRDAYDKYLQADVENRRHIKSEMINAIVMRRFNLLKLKQQYELFCRSGCKIQAMEDFIKEETAEIQKLEALKKLPVRIA